MVFERDIPGAVTPPRGQVFARWADGLEWTAREIGVRPLSDFRGPSLHSAADGLKSVQALSREIAALIPGDYWTEDVLVELQSCELILTVALKENIRWHFEVDHI